MRNPYMTNLASSISKSLTSLMDPRRKKLHAAVIVAALVVHLALHYATYIPALRPYVGNLPYFRLHVLHEAEFMLIVVYASVTLGFKAGLITVAITGITSVPFILTPYIFGRAPRVDELRDSAMQVSMIMMMGVLTAALYEINERRRRAESKSEALQFAREMKDNFASIAAHELRTPLTTIQGFSELLLSDQAPEDKKRVWIHLIHKQSSRLGTLVRDILDVSRIDAGSLEFQLEPLRLKDVVQRTLGSIPGTENGGSSLSMLIPDNVPDVLADQARLEQVLTNLVENAIKYSPKGGKILIYAHHNKTAGKVHLSVQDRGIGMSKEEQAELFTPFYRVKNKDTEDIPGTGLGLYIVKSYVKGMGGDVGVESMPRVGSEFTITLPASHSLA